MNKYFVLTTLCMSLLFAHKSDASPLKPDLSELVEQAVNKSLESFHTPGMSVGVIHKKQTLLLKGYGVLDFNKQDKVTETTQFRLASVSKGFTAASLAILVDEGKLNWHDRVTEYLPEFKMQDHWVTGEFTVKDLLTHQSGLVSGAGDSMLWPEPSGFSREEIIANIRYLTPEYSFRNKYAYNNLMYIAAGEIVAKLSGMSWEEFVDSRILKPLNMNCFAGDIPEHSMQNIAVPHGEKDGKQFYIHRNGIKGKATVSAAAGGMVCNAKSMLNWIHLLLNEGKLPEGQSLISEQQLAYMWQPHTILPISDESREWDNTFFRTYGLGWRQHNLNQYQVISHTGTLSGMQAYLAMIPELELGVIILNNGSNWGARTAVMQTILKVFTSADEAEDWVEKIEQVQKQDEIKYLANYKQPVGNGSVIKPLASYEGKFIDKWFGEFQIKQANGELFIQSNKMAKLSGKLEAFSDHSFVIRWFDQNAANDAFIHYQVNVSGDVSGFVLHPFTVKQKTNHEWRDMSFKRVEETE